MPGSNTSGNRDDERVLAVSVAELVEGVSLTVVCDANGWHFHKWASSESENKPLSVRPTEADRALRFETPTNAAAYFAQTYAGLLATVCGQGAMHFHRLPIWPGVSLTLVREPQGWRFESWRSLRGTLPPPPQSECARWFADAEDAASHFRLLCPRSE